MGVFSGITWHILHIQVPPPEKKTKSNYLFPFPQAKKRVCLCRSFVCIHTHLEDTTKAFGEKQTHTHTHVHTECEMFDMSFVLLGATKRCHCCRRYPNRCHCGLIYHCCWSCHCTLYSMYSIFRPNSFMCYPNNPPNIRISISPYANSVSDSLLDLNAGGCIRLSVCQSVRLSVCLLVKIITIKSIFL